MGASSFGVLDWAIIILYLMAMLGIGVYFSGRQKTSRMFFIAEGRLGSTLVGLSLLGTYLSAITMIALPGKAFGPEDWLWAIQLPFLVVTAVVITRLVLPRFRAAGVISVYQFLEQRIHVSTRLIASACFLALSAGRKGLILYLPARAFSEMTGVPILPLIVAMGFITIIYTVMGGIQAVVWTDAIQVVIFILGAGLSVIYLLFGVHAGGGDFIGLAAQYHKFRMWEPSLELTKLTTLWLVLQTLFETVRIYATQQDMTQRYVTAKSTAAANRGVWISILGYIPLAFMFYFIGAALFIYYQVHTDPWVIAKLAQAGTGKYDDIYPHFIATQLPIGIRGVVMAAIFAAAMSAISSGLNANSAVCAEDFYKRFWGRDRPDGHYLKVARWLTVVWGIVSIGVGILLWRVGKSGQDMWTNVMAFTTTGVLALMALAFLPIRIRPAAALAGFGAAAATIYYLFVATHVSFLLRPVLGNVVGFVVALAVNSVMVLLQGHRLNGPEERFPLKVGEGGQGTGDGERQ